MRSVRRCGVDSYCLSDLLRCIEDKPRTGREHLVQPGSAESIAIRETCRDFKYFNPTEAANYAKDRPGLQELSINIPTLKKPQVNHILRELEHCKRDPIDSRPVKGRRELEKPGGYDPKKTLRYTNEMEEFIKEEAIITVADEKKWPFGGTD